MKQGNFIISATPDPSRFAAAIEDLIDEAAPDTESRSFVVDAGRHGERLDRVLAALLPQFSRSYLQQLIESGEVSLNGALATRSAHKVKTGDKGVVELRPTLQSQAFRPEQMVLDVVFEDEHLLVVNKPAGLVVHPAPGNWSGTLLNGLLARDDKAMRLPRAGIVHRLDKDTSGLMVMARTRAAMDVLTQRIAAREVVRQYVALAHRPWSGSAARHVQAPIGRDPRQRLRMAVVAAGKPASTIFELLGNSQHGCWVRATLQTGRTHQIRVHMAHIGHALVADELYGGAPAAQLQRQALHAYRLAFSHPMTDQALEFHAPLPRDFAAALDLWDLHYNDLEWLTSHAPG